MAAPDPDPYILQPVLNDLYDARDLLDLSGPAPAPASPQPPGYGAASLFSSVSQLAAGVTHRAAAVAGSVGGSTGSVTPPLVGSPRGPASPPQAERRGSSSSLTAGVERVEVRCVEGFGNNLYVGGSDGVVEWWVYDSAGSSETRGWSLRHKHKVFPCRPISKIVLLPKVQRALVLSDGTLHPLSLPGLEALPSNLAAPLRGVVSVGLNDDELDLAGEDGEGVTDMTAIVVRRKGLGIYRVGNRMTSVKDIPLPTPPRHMAIFSTYLCTALPSGGTLNYCIIDLSDASLTGVLPVSQADPADTSFVPNPNVVVIPGENQFLVTSYTGANTIGVFLNGQGDPERGTLEWQDHPISIAVESGFIIALLRNSTVVIHSLTDLETSIQTISLEPSLAIFQLSYSPYGVQIRDSARDERMEAVRFTVLSGKIAPTLSSDSPLASPGLQSELDVVSTSVDASGDTSPNEEPPSGSGLTPPPSPKFARQPIHPPRSNSLLSAGAAARKPFSTVIAETLLIGRHSVKGLVPTPAVMQLEKLCAERKNDEAIALVDDERRKGRRGEVDVDKVTHSATMRLMHQYLACHLFVETVFERAGDYFIRGKIDPRLIVRLFPKFRGKLIGTAEEVEALRGLQSLLESMNPVEDIISAFLERNTPQPDVAEAEELRMALYYSAKNMLTEYLRKMRVSRRKGGGSRGIDSRKIDIVIDTTLAKLLADEGTTNELLTLLASPNDVVLPELEPFLAQRKYVLCTVMRQQGRTDRVLELLKEMAESSTPDPLCEDPVGELVQELEHVHDPEQLRSYALWLVKRDPERGLSLLITKGNLIQVDESELISDLRSVDPDAADRYLEYVVVGKHSKEPHLHEALLSNLLGQMEEMVQDDGIKYHIEELGALAHIERELTADAEYRLVTEPQSYLDFFTEVAPATPFKLLRLKLVLFLQGSDEYDIAAASSRLEAIGVLISERVITLGRLERDREALVLLARELPDSVSAQTYCTQGGEIVPPKSIRAMAKREPGLAEWAAIGDGRKRRTIDAGQQHKLVVELLRAYMRDGESSPRSKSVSSSRAAELLSAQGVHLDVLEILDMAPADWSLDVVSTFYKRAYRRQVHERAVWQVLKSISAGQNLETSQRYLEAVRRIPGVPVERGPDEPDETYDEKDEKAELELEDMSGASEKEERSDADPLGAGKETVKWRPAQVSRL